MLYKEFEQPKLQNKTQSTPLFEASDRNKFVTLFPTFLFPRRHMEERVFQKEFYILF